MWIRTNDTVMILTGDDRGSRGKVLRLEKKTGKVVVEGVNRVYRHVRRGQKNPQGGRLSVEVPIPLSNVALVCRGCGAAVRLRVQPNADGSKERVCKKCGASNGMIAPPKR